MKNYKAVKEKWLQTLLSTVRFRHFHHLDMRNMRKGKLAGTAAIVEDPEGGQTLHIGFTVANPNDELTRADGRQIAEQNLDSLINSVMITRANFLDLVRSGRLYHFLCVATHKNPKIANRSVI